MRSSLEAQQEPLPDGLMRRTWSAAFLLGETCRWLLIVLVLAPIAIVAGVVLCAFWLLWLASTIPRRPFWTFRAKRYDTRTHVPAPRPHARTKTVINLPTRPARRPPKPPKARVRHSLEDVRRSIAGMTRHGWPKVKVIETLERAGAVRMWSQRLGPGAQAGPADAIPAEHIRLRYRPGETVFQRYAMPPAQIDVIFDRTGRLVRGSAFQPVVKSL